LKRMTRAKARAWLSPIRDCLGSIRRTGESDEIGGHAVTRLHESDDYARIDYCIAGFLGLTDELCPQVDDAPLHHIQVRLETGAPLTVALIDSAFSALKRIESALVGLPLDRVKGAVLDAQIAIEFEEMAA